jgi:hypothetical protein
MNTTMTTNHMGAKRNGMKRGSAKLPIRFHRYPLHCRALRILLLFVAFASQSRFSARAEIPEPDNIFYGIIQLANTPITAADTNVVVEARKGSSNGPVVAAYRMGSSAVARNFYSLRVPIEALNPLTDVNSSRVGALLHLSVRDESGVRVTKTASIAVRGRLERLDFTQTDTDGDGLPDNWESQYFGSGTAANPTGDPDGDGRNNLQEFLAGTNPLAADGRHPADNAPSDNVLTIDEADAYVNAWLDGETWPVAPTNIPIAYVTRAALLASNGGAYGFTNTPPTNAPFWWVNIPRVTTSTTTRTNTIRSSAPASAPPQSRITVKLIPSPGAGTTAYAVEEQIPTGWEVLGVSHGGAFDTVQRKVRWGPFLDDGERELTYDVAVGTGQGQITLVGTGSFDGFNVAVSGNRVINVGSAGIAARWASYGRDGVGPFFVLNGELRRTYVIESSTDLLSWQVSQTVSTDAAGQFLFRPPNPTGIRYHFYRARLP